MSFWRTSLFFAYLTVLWAFLLLAWFVKLHTIAIVIFLVALVLCALRLRLNFRISNELWLMLSLLALSFALYGWFGAGERLYSVVYLFLYLEINKLWTGERTRDLLHVYGLTFFQVLAASVSTASVLFAPGLIVYLFLILGALISTTMRRDAELALMPRKQAAKSHQGDGMIRFWRHDAERLHTVFSRRLLTPRFLVWLTSSVSLVLAFGAGLFLIIPRVQAQSFLQGIGKSGPGGDLVTGFNDLVEFTGADVIQSDATIVMRAFPVRGYEFSAGYPDPGLIRLRGTSLNYYDGRSWRKYTPSSDSSIAEDRLRLVYFTQNNVNSHPGSHVRTLISLEPNRRGYLFGPDRAERYELESIIPLRIDKDAQSLQIALSNWTVPIKYTVDSVRMNEPSMIVERPVRRWARTPEDALRQFVLNLVEHFHPPGRDDFDRMYLQLPDHADINVVDRLAQEWAGDLEDPHQIARRIERSLKEHIDYSLNIDFASRMDHLTRFLTVEQRGHCEYFATAMVLMLRSRGVPARIVNGYASDEWVRGGGGYFLVRQEHAHSWVEAWIPGLGWITYDPTPSIGIGGAAGGSSIYRVASRWFDMLKLVWYEHVIDYDARRQGFLYRFMFDSLDLLPRTQAAFTSFLAEGIGRDLNSPRRRVLAAGVVLVLAVLVLLLLRELRRLKVLRQLARLTHTETYNEAREKVREYLHLLLEVERQVPRPKAQTPLEYARHVATSRNEFDDFLSLTETYYGARYNGAQWSHHESTRVNALLRLLRESSRDQSHDSRQTPSKRATPDVPGPK